MDRQPRPRWEQAKQPCLTLSHHVPSLRGHASLQSSVHRVSGRRDFHNPEKWMFWRSVQQLRGKLRDPLVHVGCSCYHLGLALARPVEL
uniref:Uncharacterized protein n=1 Tax=Mus musculus TaxID=10090 RepID=Q8C4V9_MOUSE|nr:unnamed protein product [Mus musculus]